MSEESRADGQLLSTPAATRDSRSVKPLSNPFLQSQIEQQIIWHIVASQSRPLFPEIHNIEGRVSCTNQANRR